MKKRINLPAVIAAVLLAVILAGCETTVTFEYERLPRYNTLGIQRMAVMPFTFTIIPGSKSESADMKKRAAVAATGEAVANIEEMNHFTVVGPEAIEKAKASRTNIENLADAVLTGDVYMFSVRDTSSVSFRTRPDMKTEKFTLYKRELNLAITINLALTRDGTVVARFQKHATVSDSKDDQGLLLSANDLLLAAVSKAMADIGRDFAPYTITQTKKLWKETSENSVLQKRTTAAEKLMKTGYYINARDAYLKIYEEFNTFAAAYNAMLIIEALEGTEEALEFMQEVKDNTKIKNNYSGNQIKRLEGILDDQGMLAEYKENKNKREKAIAYSVNEILAKMPAGAALAVINNSRNEKQLAEIITLGLIHELKQKKVTLVDRENKTLLDAEKRYQLSGNVSDSEMVRLGNEVGIDALISVSVTGSGSERRLSLRMMDVKRNRVLYQSPNTSDMDV